MRMGMPLADMSLRRTTTSSPSATPRRAAIWAAAGSPPTLSILRDGATPWGSVSLRDRDRLGSVPCLGGERPLDDDVRVRGGGAGRGFELRDSAGGDTEHFGDLCLGETGGPQLRNGVSAKLCQVVEQGLLLGDEPAQLLGTPPGIGDGE